MLPRDEDPAEPRDVQPKRGDGSERPSSTADGYDAIEIADTPYGCPPVGLPVRGGRQGFRFSIYHTRILYPILCPCRDGS